MPKEEREKTTEKWLQRKIKELWKRTKEGGIFVIVEDDTGGKSSMATVAARGSVRLSVRRAVAAAAIECMKGAGAPAKLGVAWDRGPGCQQGRRRQRARQAGSAARRGGGPAAREPTGTGK